MDTTRKRSARGGGSIIEVERDKRYRIKVVTGYNGRGNPVQRSETFRGTRAEAEQRRAQMVIEAAAARGQAADMAAAGMTLGQLLDLWLADAQSRCRASTLSEYRRLVPDLKNDLGALRLSQVDVPEINGYYLRLSQGGMTDPTIRRRHAIISAALNWAVQKQLVKLYPLTGVRVPKASTPKSEVVPSVGHARALLQRALVEDPTVYGLVALELGTGCRRGELVGLRWSNVDLDGDEPFIRIAENLTEAGRKRGIAEPPKSKAGLRKIALDPRTVEILRDYRQWQEDEADGTLVADPYVLSYRKDRGIPPSGSGLLHGFQRLCRKMEAATGESFDYTLKSLRHWQGTQLFASGMVGALDAAARMGHADPSITMRYYAHTQTKQDRKAALVTADVLFPDS